MSPMGPEERGVRLAEELVHAADAVQQLRRIETESQGLRAEVICALEPLTASVRRAIDDGFFGGRRTRRPSAARARRTKDLLEAWTLEIIPVLLSYVQQSPCRPGELRSLREDYFDFADSPNVADLDEATKLDALQRQCDDLIYLMRAVARHLS